ncbi:Metastasis-associated in colon cancer protein 1 [Rhizoctonia solani]|uniref:Metastasis-associated in colon cancer protein 1 n=1 Tax=Rhizoctonia solani TaxID=456999 RepID=A0A0K6FYP3_9AGAM|nr:Metastasis-associated in colon cancer protein 1 [Rhizoctonia solani]
MNRKVAKSKKATRIVPVAPSENVPEGGQASSSGGGDAQVQLAPPRKQARVAKNKRSKINKNNAMSGLLTLPVELLTEVMSYLRPIDILYLSRTCKSFRTTLMRRSSEPIWKHAAKNLVYTLPPPPPWMDMPQYVSVVYTSDCSACGGKSVPKESKWDPEFQPVLLVRLCVACQPDVLVPSGEIPEHVKPLLTITHVNIFPGPGINLTSGNYGLRVEMQKILKGFKENRERFKDREYLRSWLLPKRDAIQRYSKRPHWDLIEYVEQDREREREKLKSQFRRGVENRLVELGWEHDIGHAAGKEFRLLTTQPRNLTDRIWKNLYPKLQTRLEEARIDRLATLPLVKQKALINLWEDKHHDLGSQVIVHFRHESVPFKPVVVRLNPLAYEAMDWPPIKQLLDSCHSYYDAYHQLPEIWESIRPLVLTWQNDVESQLANRLRQDESFESLSGSRMNSMVVSGQPVSDSLNLLLRADSILQFADNTARYFPDNFLENWHPEGIWCDNSVTSPSVLEGAQSFTVAREQAKALLQCLGHPNASHIGMVALGKRFVCGTCVRCKHKDTKVYDWKELLDHYISVQLVAPGLDDAIPDPIENPGPSFAATMHHPEIAARYGHPLAYNLTVDDARKYTQDASMLLAEQPWSSYEDKYACLHCTDCHGVDLPTVVAHVQHNHQIKPEAHRDYESYNVYIQQSLEATYEYAS